MFDILKTVLLAIPKGGGPMLILWDRGMYPLWNQEGSSDVGFLCDWF